MNHERLAQALPEPMPPRLTHRFYRRPTLELAPRVLGQILVSRVGGHRTAGVITELEIYLGEDDRACHARNGPTPRNRVMYGPPGHAYIYFVYGMHHCLNIVTEPEGLPAALLLRALRPVDGLEIMRERRLQGSRAGRKPPPGDAWLASGPGRLCQALGLDRSLDGADLTGGILYLERGRPPRPQEIHHRPRVGIPETAGPWRSRPWNLSLRPLRRSLPRRD
jgi:DNA-3-methyladenine glycosylase